jgi:hypothetical protein
MDTDDLSTQAYKAVIIEAEKFHHDLMLQFGLLADECSDEDEYLEKSIQLISELRTLKPGDLDEVFFDDLPDFKHFQKTLDRILENIQKVKKIPLGKRTFDI